jgi:hypothetical protein
MVISLYIVLITVFITLSTVHWYWAFGGLWGFYQALPTNKEGKRVLNPRRIDSAVVGFGLLLFAIFYIIKLEKISLEIPVWLSLFGSGLISLIFFLRAIGDFRYVGFFKKVRTTGFAYRDSWYFSPLCLLIATISIFLQLW